MAFVVLRRDGRFEIRESVATPAGPRSRTLATFHRLSDATLEHAQRRATRPFDRGAVVASADRAGAPRDTRETVRLAHRLLTELEAGRNVPSVLARALARHLETNAPFPDSLPPMADWLGVGLRDRGDALRDLLRVTDRLPRRPQGRRRRFPRIVSTPT